MIMCWYLVVELKNFDRYADLSQLLTPLPHTSQSGRQRFAEQWQSVREVSCMKQLFGRGGLIYFLFKICFNQLQCGFYKTGKNTYLRQRFQRQHGCSFDGDRGCQQPEVQSYYRNMTEHRTQKHRNICIKFILQRWGYEQLYVIYAVVQRFFELVKILRFSSASTVGLAVQLEHLRLETNTLRLQGH